MVRTFQLYQQKEHQLLRSLGEKGQEKVTLFWQTVRKNFQTVKVRTVTEGCC